MAKVKGPLRRGYDRLCQRLRGQLVERARGLRSCPTRASLMHRWLRGFISGVRFGEGGKAGRVLGFSASRLLTWLGHCPFFALK